MFHVLKRFIAINFRDSLPLLGIYLLSVLLSFAKVALLVFMPKVFIDAAMAKDWNLTVNMVLLFGAAAGFFFLLETYLKPITDRAEMRVNVKAANKLYSKIMTLSYEYLEDPAFLDLKERAVFPITNQGAILNMFVTLKQLIQSVVILAGLIGLLFQVSWILVVGILALGVLHVVLMVYSSSFMQNFFRDLIPINRKYGYYFSAMMEPTNQKDIRLFNLSPFFVKTVQHYNREICDYLQTMQKFIGKVLGSQEAIATSQAALSFFMVGKSVLAKTMTIGNFSMYMSGALRFGSELSTLVMHFGEFLPMLGYLEPYVEVMDMEDGVYQGTEHIHAIGEIEFKNVSFSYPRSDKEVLKDVSFTFHKGEKLSLVGPNGAGKTTLVKLLTGLYRPTKGEILIDGKSMKDVDMHSFRQSMSAIFQDFKFFPMSLEKNLVGNEKDQEKLELSLDKVEMKDYVENLPYKLDTVVGRSYDKVKGRDFSGGQLQKLAIARALYKGGDLIILDEPTSALDPLAEAEVYEHFNELVGEKSALYISHRMSSSRFCDRVLVIAEGKIMEEGTHDELVQLPEGIYRNLFETQASYYQEA